MIYSIMNFVCQIDNYLNIPPIRCDLWQLWIGLEEDFLHLLQ
jgi:hypothetical protein